MSKVIRRRTGCAPPADVDATGLTTATKREGAPGRGTGPITSWSQGLLEGTVRATPTGAFRTRGIAARGDGTARCYEAAVARVSPRGVSVTADGPAQSMSSSASSSMLSYPERKSAEKLGCWVASPYFGANS